MTHQTVTNSHTIGHRIRELRQKKGLTQTELGQLLGCAQTTIAEWEKKKGRAPNKNLLGKVAEVLEISVEYLLGLEKTERPHIPCYGEFLSKEFIWPNKASYEIEIPKAEYSPSRFSIQLLDNLLEPIIYKNDYAIFEKQPPENGDIVAVRFQTNGNKGIISMWRQWRNAVMLIETNLDRIGEPYFFEIISPENEFSYHIKNGSDEKIVVEGKLVAVKRGIKSAKSYSKVSYIFF
jgi:transcriptional regulator with XRE-family HTH domain